MNPDQSKHSRQKRLAGIFLKTLMWLITIPIGLVLLLFLLLQIPEVQDFAIRKATGFVSKKTGAKVALKKLNITFPQSVGLEDLYVEDLSKDTLLYVHYLKVNINLLDLLSKRVNVDRVELNTVTAKVSRAENDSNFNFSFIPEAFAGNKQPEPAVSDAATDSSRSGWQISVGTVGLHAIRLRYHDGYTGTFADLHLGDLGITVDKLDFDNKVIAVDRVGLSNTSVSFTQKPSHQPPKPDSPSKPFGYALRLGELKLADINALYTNVSLNQQAALALGSLSVKPRKIDLAGERIEVESIALSNTTAKYVMGPADPSQKPEPAVSDTVSIGASPSNWVAVVDKLDLSDNQFYYDNNQVPKAKTGLDYNHIFAGNFNLHASDITGSAKAASIRLEELRFQEQSGFGLKAFRGKLVYDTSHVEASDLYIETNHSTIRDHLSMRYKSLEDLGKDIGSLYVSAQLTNTEIRMSDILYFVPGLHDIQALRLTPQSSVRLNTDIRGLIDDLDIRKFSLFTPQKTILTLHGSLKQVMKPDRLYLDLRDISMTSTRNDLLALLSPTIIPSSIELPESFALSGNAKGYLKNFDANLQLLSSMGNVLAEVHMDPKAGNKEQPYDISVKTEHFHLGKLLKQEATLGELSTSLKVKGSGLSAKTIHSEVDLLVEKATVKGYTYNNLTANGTIAGKSFSGKAGIKDPNIVFDFDGSLRFDSASPSYVFTLDLQGADLKALHFSDEDLRVSTLVRSNLSMQGDNITGAARIYNTLIVKNNKRYPVDSIVLLSEEKNGLSDISLRSAIIEAGLKGQLHMTELAASFRQFIDHYYTLPGAKLSTQLKPQEFDYFINLKDPSLIAGKAVPELKELSPVSVSGSYSSSNYKLITDLSVPYVTYSDNKLDSIRLRLNSDASALNYSLGAAQLSNPNIKLENLSLLGDVKNNEVAFRLSTARDDSIKLLAASGTVKSINGTHELRLNPELILNAEAWQISPENYLQFSPAGLVANELKLSNSKQSILVNSLEKNPKAPLQLSFNSFELSTISKIFENKTELLKGEVNGTATIEKRGETSALIADMEIRGFTFESVPIGDVKLKAGNTENPQVYDLRLDIGGAGNELSLSGKYNTASKDQALDQALDIRSLNMKTIEPFTAGQVTRMSGNLDGRLDIRGSTALPDINGKLHFNESALNPRIIDSYLRIPDGKLSFDHHKVSFDHFTLIDSLDNQAVLNGGVDIKDIKNPTLDLHLKSGNFLALHTSKQDNPLYFGTIFLDSDVDILGSINSPAVKARLKLNKGSEITYIKPESEVGKAENKGIIEFVDTLYADNIMTRRNDTLEQRVLMKGIDVDASITFDKSVMLKMLVDQQSGDSLYIVGGGTLNFVLDQSGKTTLTGKYRIDDGGYHLSISDVVRRDFRIEPGSSVTWSGDLLDAYVDIKAIYTIKTSPIDLIQNDLAGADELERNKYRNMLTFLVYLKMSGFLSSPEISFDIQLAPKDKGAVNGTVNSKLEELRADETQLNKQVFALLTLRRFISDNPLDNGGGGGGLSSASRNSASKVLTQQLSSLSQKYVKGVDLDLGINSFEDYSTGQEQGRTQLQIGVSKQLFNDKVTIRVGGNVELEGERAKQNNASDVAGNINIDYKLTEDGRYKLRGFRQNQYENPIEGEITKTGVGVVYVRNYNKLKELFTKPRQAKKPAEGKTR